MFDKCAFYSDELGFVIEYISLEVKIIYTFIIWNDGTIQQHTQDLKEQGN